MTTEMSTILTKRYLVTGEVQGVFFRASTRKEAQALGLSGHARNLPDGRVEVVVRGMASQVKRLEDWLWQGPPAAQVDEVSSSEYPDEVPEGFRVL